MITPQGAPFLGEGAISNRPAQAPQLPLLVTCGDQSKELRRVQMIAAQELPGEPPRGPERQLGF